MKPHFTMDYLNWPITIVPVTILNFFGIVDNLTILRTFGLMEGTLYPQPFPLHPLCVSKQIQPVFSHRSYR